MRLHRSFGLATLAALLISYTACVPAATIDFDAATIGDLDKAFRAGTLTSEQLVQECLARIEAYDA